MTRGEAVGNVQILGLLFLEECFKFVCVLFLDCCGWANGAATGLGEGSQIPDSRRRLTWTVFCPGILGSAWTSKVPQGKMPVNRVDGWWL